MVIELISVDIEGCITPSKRTKSNLAGLKNIQKYCDMVNKKRMPPIHMVTGRQAAYVEGVVQTIGAIGQAFSVPSVTENGAVFYDHNKRCVLGFHPLVEKNTNNLNRIRATVKSLENKYKENIRQELGKSICISLNPIEMGVNDLYHIVVEEFNRKGISNIINITHSASAVDITPKGINKLTGMAYILKKLKINPKNVLGIGDTIADAAWLNYIGTPAAPSNVTDELRKNVKGLYVAKKEDAEGVSEIIRHFVTKP